MQSEAEDVRSIVAELNYVIFTRDNFVVAEFETIEDIPPDARNSLKRDATEGPYYFAAVGTGLPIRQGAKLVLSGSWVPNPKKPGFLELKVDFFEDYVGSTREEIVAYLSSDALKGIGKKSAEMIYDAFGENTIEVLSQEPEKLLELPGIGEARLNQIVDSYQKNQSLQMLTMMLSPRGVSYPTIVRIYRALGSGAAKAVRENPYVLGTVTGFGFRRADEVGLSLEASPHCVPRLEGAINFTMRQMQAEGHMYILQHDLERRALGDLNRAGIQDHVSIGEFREALEGMLNQHKLKRLHAGGEMRVYTRHAFLCEKVAAKTVSHFVRHRGETPWTESAVNNAIGQVESYLNLTLDPLQKEAIRMGLLNRISIITGGPGTGKTTILYFLVEAMKILAQEEGENRTDPICLAAPTGRAARHMAAQTKHDASTLHSLLDLRPDEWSDLENEHPDIPDSLRNARMLIVDEFSMVEGNLMAELMSHVPEGIQLVFVGDADQLPSVGPGNVLAQLLEVTNIPHVTLTKIFRQKSGNRIAENSQRIRLGIPELVYDNTFKFIGCRDEKEGAETIREMLESSSAQTKLEDIQILTPMRQKGQVSSDVLNRELHDVVNPPSSEKKEAYVGSTCYREGDRVMQTRNTADVSNGEVGIVTWIAPNSNNKDAFAMNVRFRDGDLEQVVSYTYEDAVDLTPAIAITIHKSQGGEYPFVVVPIFGTMGSFLQRNLLYTAVTRARRQVVLVGNQDAVNFAICRMNADRRRSSLHEMIWAYLRSPEEVPQAPGDDGETPGDVREAGGEPAGEVPGEADEESPAPSGTSEETGKAGEVREEPGETAEESLDPGGTAAENGGADEVSEAPTQPQEVEESGERA